jgi:peptidyl-prolyl cis-trans isomerase SurA
MKTLLAASLSVILFLAPAGRCAAGVLLDRVVAVVNKEAITWSELHRAMEFELGRQLRGLSEEEKKKVLQQSEARFLESMIDLRVQLQHAGKLGISASEEQVDRAVEGIRNRYSMDEEEFLGNLRAEGFTMKKYREVIREQIVISRLIDREVRSRIILTEEDVRKGLEELNLGEGILYGLRQIFFSLPEGADMDALGERVSGMMDRLRAGEDFGELASRYSEGPNAGRGGDLGFIPRNQLAAEFMAAIKDLSPGQYTEPFRSARGVHILMLTARKDATEFLKERLFAREHRDWLRELREKSFIEMRI